MNICTECKHFKQSSFNETKFHECKHIECRNPVSGYAQACIIMRKKTEPCGIQGNLWELGFVGKTISIAKAKKAA